MALAGLTEVADPRVHLLQELKGLRTHQDVHTVDAVGSGGGSVCGGVEKYKINERWRKDTSLEQEETEGEKAREEERDLQIIFEEGSRQVLCHFYTLYK